jgi:uncharacterized protein (UPF0335 family)
VEDHTELLIRIDSKVDEVKEKLHSIELVQGRMEGDLKYHIKRTDLLEEQVSKIDEKIKPIEAIKSTSGMLAKIVAFLMGVAVAVSTIIKLISNKE